MSDPVQLIKDKADIVELISEIIPVKRSGSSYLALCPFHNDSKPSMHISSSKGIYKCFACGAGGDLFRFWSEYYQKDFKETLKDLAQKYGVELNLYEANPQKKEERNLFIKLHDLAAEFYHQKLLLDQKASITRTYLKDRSLSGEIIAKFKLGYSSSDKREPNLLIRHLKSKNEKLTDDDLLKAGLAYKTDSGDIIDRFRSRLMIPVLDERGRCIAFGARTLNEEYGPKYINSPETEIYIKGDNLYGLDQAKEAIRKKDSVILVEGFFDVISLNQAGLENIVANQGTALTANQIKKLAKFTQSKKIYLCFDTDQAGEKATASAAQIIDSTLHDVDYELRVIRVPGGKDPDEYIKEHSLEAFNELITNAPYYIDYKINKLIADCDLNDSFQKDRVAKQIKETIAQVKKEIVRYDYIKKAAERMGIAEKHFETAFIERENENPYAQVSVQKNKPIQNEIKNQKNSIQAIENDLIVLFLEDRTYLERFLSEEKALHSLEAKEILNHLTDLSFENPDINSAEILYDLLQEKTKTESRLASLMADIGFQLERQGKEDYPGESYLKLVTRLTEYRLRLDLENLKLDMKKYQPNSTEWLDVYNRKLEQTRKIQALK